MLISVRHNFVFIAMPKCASTSVETAFGRHADVRITGVSRLKHATFKVYETHLKPFVEDQSPKQWQCEPFSLFREPLDWLFSWYSYRTREHSQRDESWRRSRSVSGGVTFADFLNENFKKKPARFARTGRQTDYIEDAKGNLGAVTLYRYEDIDSLVRELSQRIQKDVALEKRKISPERDFGLTEDQIAEARRKLKLEYAVHAEIPVRAVSAS